MPGDARDHALVERGVSIASTAIIAKSLLTRRANSSPGTDNGRLDRAAIEVNRPDARARMDLLGRAVEATAHLVGNRYAYADINPVPMLAYRRQRRQSKAALSETGGPGANVDGRSQCAGVWTSGRSRFFLDDARLSGGERRNAFAGAATARLATDTGYRRFVATADQPAGVKCKSDRVDDRRRDLGRRTVDGRPPSSEACDDVCT